MALRKLVAGNWKMNGSLASLAELDAIAGAGSGSVDRRYWNRTNDLHDVNVAL